MPKNFSIRNRLRGIRYAITGLKLFFKTQYNAWIFLFGTFFFIGAGIFFGIHHFDWILLLIAMTIVWMAEVVNTAIEFTCDRITLFKEPMIGKIKDIAAATVLVACIGSGIVATMIFWPYVERLVE